MTTRITSGHIGDLRARAQRAGERFEAARANLYRTDGEPIYSESEHEEHMRRLRVERDGVLGDVGPALDEVLSGLRAERDNLQAGDVATSLSTEELSRAASLRDLAADAVSSLSEGDLLARLRAVGASGDRASALSYARAATRRMQADASRRRSQARQAGENTAAVGPDPTLQGAIEDLEHAVGGEERRTSLEDVRTRLEAADEAKRFADTLRYGPAYQPVYSIPGRAS